MTTGHDRTPAVRLPILQGVLPITAAQIPAEIVAGITLAALAVPEVMGYTKISGTPVITGLYTMLIPTALFALFGSSRHLVVGADSATAAILAGGLVGIASTGSDEYVALAAVLALMAAGFLILARLIAPGIHGGLPLAHRIDRVPDRGRNSGRAGADRRHAGPEGRVAMARWGRSGTIFYNWNRSTSTRWRSRSPCWWSSSASKMVSKRIPGALIAVIGAMVASWAFGLGEHVHVLGAVPGGLPHLGLPQVDWGWPLMATLLPTAFAMFVVILAQSAATSRAYAARYDEHFSENTDLVGLALANIGAGLSGTFVVNGSPTKTQMVDSAGGRTQLSLLVMAAIVLLILLFLTAPLAYMPEAVLSAIVFLIGVDLIDLGRDAEGLRRTAIGVLGGTDHRV